MLDIHRIPQLRKYILFFPLPSPKNRNANYLSENLLAASIDPKNETFNQSYSKDSDFSEAPAFLGCFKLPVPPVVRRPQTITRAAVRVLQAGWKAIRGVFGLKHSFKCRRLKPSPELTFPKNVRRVEKQSTKTGRFLLGYMLRNFQRGP